MHVYYSPLPCVYTYIYTPHIEMVCLCTAACVCVVPSFPSCYPINSKHNLLQWHWPSCNMQLPIIVFPLRIKSTAARPPAPDLWIWKAGWFYFFTRAERRFAFSCTRPSVIKLGELRVFSLQNDDMVFFYLFLPFDCLFIGAKYNFS